MELTCQYTVAERGQCRQEVEAVRETVLSASLEEEWSKVVRVAAQQIVS